MRLRELALAPDGRGRPDAPFGRGPMAARVLRGAILVSSAVAGRLPERVAGAFAAVGGTIEWAVRPAKRRMLARNLCHVLAEPPESPRVRALVRREVLSEARRSADLLWAIAHPEELLARTRVEGLEHARAALAEGNGIVLASPHIGGWEVLAPLPRAALGIPTTVLATDDWLAWAVAGLRMRAGLGVVYDSEPILRLVEALRRGEAVLVLGDYAKDEMRTYPVRLLDGVVELPAGPATLSRLCSAPILPFAAVAEGPRRWRVEIEEPVHPPPQAGGREAERAALQALADTWSVMLRRHAEHWAAVYPMSWREGR